MKRVALATVILGAVALTAHAQQGVGISGRVVADDTGDPIANARVAITPPVPVASAVLADADGRFTLTLPPDRSSVAADKSGYSPREIKVTAANPSIEIRLLRGAAVSGRIVDEHGDPVMNVRVFVENSSAPSNPASNAGTTTDDRGDYRVGGLPPGSFFVGVASLGPPVRREIGPNQFAITSEPLRTYYPGVKTRDEAEVFRLQPGDEKSGIDLVVPGGSTMQMQVMMSPLPPRTSSAAGTPNAGTIRGRVVATDGRAIPRAAVRLLPTALGFQPSMTTADDDGRFEFQELDAGPYRLAASKVGYSEGDNPITFGVPALTAGVAVELAASEVRERIDLPLARWGAMNGRVFDEVGDPMQGVSVQLLQVRYQAGRRRLVPAGGAARVTDDLGRFRIFGVQPGQYIVSASAGGVQTAELPGYSRSYFPGTPNASEAQFVRMALSQEQTGVDFSMAREKTATISGTLLNAAGEPSTMGSVKLLPSQRSGSVTSVAAGARLMKDGKFEFPNVTPGQYVIQVDRGRRNAATEGEFGTLPVSVDGADITDLVLQTSTGSSISGRVTFETFRGTQIPKPGQLDLSPVPIDPDLSPAVPGSADVHADWSFEIHGVNGPRRLRLQRAPPEWTLKEIRVNGIEATDRPLAFGKANQSLADVEVVLTDRINTVSGTIVDDHGRAAPAAKVVVFSPDRDRWYPTSRYLRAASAGADGAISLTGLPSGNYYAAAVPALPSDGDEAWQDPAFLESLLAHAATFTLGEGQQLVLNLKLP
jgi:hypothetical protein